MAVSTSQAAHIFYMTVMKRQSADADAPGAKWEPCSRHLDVIHLSVQCQQSTPDSNEAYFPHHGYIKVISSRSTNSHVIINMQLGSLWR